MSSINQRQLVSWAWEQPQNLLQLTKLRVRATPNPSNSATINLSARISAKNSARRRVLADFAVKWAIYNITAPSASKTW